MTSFVVSQQGAQTNASQEPTDWSPSAEWVEISLQRKVEEKDWGMRARKKGKALIIVEVKEGGAVARHNINNHEPHKGSLKVGNVIHAVNSIFGDANALL